MNLYSHVLNKDCRRLAGPIAAWWVLVAINSYFELSTHVPVYQGLNVIASACMACAMVFFWVLTVIIAAGVVLEDPPKGTTAFWLTRPLARGQVTAAKCTLLGALTLIPVVITVVSLICYGVGARGVAIAACSQILSTALVPLAVAAFAIAAESFGQFAITAILILLVTGATAGVATATWQFHRMLGQTDHIAPPTPESLSTSRLLAGQVIALALAGGIVVWRYLRRHVRFVLGVVAVGSLVCMLTPICWPWNFIAAITAPSVEPGVSKTGVSFTMQTERSQDQRVLPQINATINSRSDLSEGFVVAESLSQQRLVWADGADRALEGPSEFRYTSADLAEPAAIARALAPAVVLNLPRKQASGMTIRLSEENRERLSRAPAVFHANVQGVILRCEAVGEIPLEAGARRDWGSSQFRLESLVHHPEGGYSIVLRDGSIETPLAKALDRNKPGTPWRRLPNTTVVKTAGNVSVVTAEVFEGEDPIFALVNRQRGEALLATQRGNVSRSVDMGGYTLRHFRISIDREPVDAGWINQAVLVCLQFRQVGTATGTVTSPPFDLVP